jgi:hypothetical protein
MGNERWGEAAGPRISPSGATKSRSRQMLCLILSVSVGLAACAGSRVHPAIPAVVSDSDQVACAEFAHQRTEQMRREAARASSSHWTGNDVAWTIMIIAASPVLVTMFVAALPFGSWKALRNPNPDTWQLVEERLVSLCTEPARLAATVGPRHPDTALAVVALADQYREADRIESALDRYRQALTIQEDALGRAPRRGSDSGRLCARTVEGRPSRGGRVDGGPGTPDPSPGRGECGPGPGLRAAQPGRVG